MNWTFLRRLYSTFVTFSFPMFYARTPRRAKLRVESAFHRSFATFRGPNIECYFFHVAFECVAKAKRALGIYETRGASLAWKSRVRQRSWICEPPLVGWLIMPTSVSVKRHSWWKWEWWKRVADRASKSTSQPAERAIANSAGWPYQRPGSLSVTTSCNGLHLEFMGNREFCVSRATHVLPNKRVQ